MKDITFKEVENATICLSEDLQMLTDGSWIPDDDSIEASQKQLEIIINFLSMIKKENYD